MKPFQVVKDFEKAVAEYTGAPYCVAVNSCTNGLFLCLKYIQASGLDFKYEKDGRTINKITSIEIPKWTYLSVPMQIKHAGFDVTFRADLWSGAYQLEPFYLFDSARLFTSDMYNKLEEDLFDGYSKLVFMVTSHHWSKILGIQQGGCILHNSPDADVWLRKARFDGRTEGIAPKDDDPILGWHMYLSPEIAAEGLVRLSKLPKNNPDMPWDDYPDLSKLEIFK